MLEKGSDNIVLSQREHYISSVQRRFNVDGCIDIKRRRTTLYKRHVPATVFSTSFRKSYFAWRFTQKKKIYNFLSWEQNAETKKTNGFW